MKRKLASVQVVESVEPIIFRNKAGEDETAESIVHIQVLGWHLVSQVNQFSVGDRCVYVEYDSVLPERPEFEFLRKGNFIEKNGFKGFFIKTRRLLGMISQGIAFPLDILPVGEYFIGDDVTDLLGIVKYDPPLPATLQGEGVPGGFPEGIPRTDETRIHTAPDVLKRHAGKRMYATLKCDGSSMTAVMRDGKLLICSHNVNLKESENNTFWQVANKYELAERMKRYAGIFGDFAIQGELIGPGIQKNRHGLQAHDMYVFNVMRCGETGCQYLNYTDAVKVAEDLGLKFVPLVAEFELNHTLEEMEELAYGPDLINPKNKREGIVVRPVNEDWDMQLGRLSFKVLPPKGLV